MTSAGTHPDIPLSWHELQTRARETPGSPAQLTATLWAFGVLREVLGDDWPQRATHRRVAGHLTEAVGSMMGNSHLLRFAMRLQALRDISGGGKVIRDLRSNLTSERIRHTDLQLEVATLGAPLGWSAALEVPHPTGGSDLDVRLARGVDAVDVEVCALLPGQRTKQSFAMTRQVLGMPLRLYAFAHGVHIAGDPGAVFRSGNLDERRVLVMDTVRAVAESRTPRTLFFDGQEIVFSLVPDGIDEEHTAALDPRLDPRRFWSTLEKKVEQAKRNGATWLRIDVMDLHWQMSHLITLPLSEKATVIGGVVRSCAGKERVLDGVVVSSGLLLAREPPLPEDCSVAEGVAAMTRGVSPGMARQTVFVPLTQVGCGQVSWWTALYSQEEAWTEQALNAFGLPSLTDLYPSALEAPSGELA